MFKKSRVIMACAAICALATTALLFNTESQQLPKSVPIRPTITAVSFQAFPATGAAPLSTWFSYRVPDSPKFNNRTILDDRIDFGDGSQNGSNWGVSDAPAEIQQHTYTTAGTYTAKVFQGNELIATTPIIVSAPTAKR
jgi:hypothetical protein